MRQKFEKRSSMAFYENNSGFEEKIMNLAYANLSPFSSKQWNITAIKSPVVLQKLYKSVNDTRVLESAIALIICESIGQADKNGYIHDEAPAIHEVPEAGSYDLKLLTLSIGYAAKYYCIDYFIIRNFSKEILTREFALNRNQSTAGIICLGYFTNSYPKCVPLFKNNYTDTVRFL